MLRRPIALLAACLIANPAFAQAPVPAAPQAAAANQTSSTFDSAQLDALLAPIALYPDPLLTQILMAATFPLQIVEASRWLEDPAHKSLTGQALNDALNKESWDPSVKSLVPFPQVLAQLNGNLDWVQQLGYAVSEQQKDVMDAVQRLRRQAQDQGHLKSSPQQVVRSEPQPSGGPPDVVIEPAQPDVVYVPSYDPAQVYGTWPYASYPPVVLPPAPGYAVGTALATGLAFGAGVAITSSLWGWASPNWGRGNVDVNVNRWNNINVNRAQIHSGAWNASVNRPGGRTAFARPPTTGPVGHPVRGNGLAANAIGRQNVHVPGSAVNRPAINPPHTGQRPDLKPGTRPNPPRTNAGNRPNGLQRPNAAANRPNFAGNHPNVPANRQQFQRPAQGSGAFAGLSEGNHARQFQQRGSQSRQFGQGGGFQHPAGGFQRSAGGGGGFHGGGGGARGGGGFHGRR